MNEFISNILSRHLDPVGNIVPRLPGKFEPVNFSAANATDLSPDIDTVQEINLPQPTAKPDKADNNVTGVNITLPLAPKHDNVSSKQVFQYTNEVLPENKNADEVQGNKNIIPLMQELPGDKNDKPETFFEIPGKQEQTVPGKINPVAITPVIEKPSADLFNEKTVANDPELKEMPENYFIDKTGDTVIPAGSNGTLYQHISILKQKIVKASAEKKTIFSEDKKNIQPGLVKPVMSNQNVRTKPDTSLVLNEQPMSSVIKVSIGRIEVRAVTNAAPPKVNRSVLQKPNLTLEDYLKRKSG